MEKIQDIKELKTSNLIDLSIKNEYYLIVINDDNGDDVILDDDSLSTLLKDIGVFFIDNDDCHYIYCLNDITFAVPYQNIEWEDGSLDQYLNFDEKFIC